MASGMFRLIAAVSRTVIISNTGGTLALLLLFLLGGFLIPRGEIPKWCEWGYWVSPMMYCYNALAVNEMLAPRWMNKLASDNTTELGVAVLENFDIFPEKEWYWIGAAALLGYAVFFNILFTIALMYLNPPGKPQAIISEEAANEMEVNQEETKEQPRLSTRSKTDSLPRSLSTTDGNNTREMEILRMSSRHDSNGLSRSADSSFHSNNGLARKRGMVLPFTPLAMAFNNVNYYVDMPPHVQFSAQEISSPGSSV